jgi:HD-like signal output (HDOD) protein/ActR/RegA family two-component response regulator
MDNQTALQILFVDDEEMLLNGLRRSISAYCDNCGFTFVQTAEQALVLMSQKPFDVVITDLRMPRMDGIQLLERVKQQYPQTLRIVLSGNIKDVPTLKLVEVAHQVIAKPCDYETLIGVIDRSVRVRMYLSNPRLLGVIHNIRNLPSVPSIYTELMDAIDNETVDSTDIGRIIAKDTAMTAKILQLVNSAFFGIPGKITSAERATAYLGINTVRALVLGTHIFSSFESKYRQFFSIDSYWDCALKVSAIAKYMARDLGMGKEDQEAAQVAGIIHNIGTLLLLDYTEYKTRLQISRKAVPPLMEYKLFGVSHAEIGAYLLGIWGFSDMVVEAVALHHWPRTIIQRRTDLATVLHCANGIYEMLVRNDKHVTPYLYMPYIKVLDFEEQVTEWKDYFLSEDNILNAGIPAERSQA